MNWLNGNRILLVIGLIAASLIGGSNAKADLVMDAASAEDLQGCLGKGVSFSNDGLRLYVAVDLISGKDSRDICVVERESLDAPWGDHLPEMKPQR